MSLVVLVMHEPLGAAFERCAEHVLGSQPKLTVYDIAADADTEASADNLLQLLLQTPHTDALVLCDIYGATPFNIAQSAVKRANESGRVVHLLTGANLCMVLKAITSSANESGALSEVVRLRALTGIVDSESTQ